MPTANLGRVRLQYELSGKERGPVLVLANSLGSNLRMWDKVLTDFERRYLVLRFDMRGHGESGVAREPFTLDDLGHDLLQLLDAMQAERASLCGLSLGGLVSLWVGIHAPSRVDRLILANTAAHIGSHDLWEQRIATVGRAGLSSLALETLERWFTPAYRVQHPGEMGLMRKMIAGTDPAGYAACCAVLRDADLSKEITTIEAATLIITGTHDPATPPIGGRALHAGIRNSKYVELNASHMSAWECAQEFAASVMQHLAAGEETHG